MPSVVIFFLFLLLRVLPKDLICSESDNEQRRSFTITFKLYTKENPDVGQIIPIYDKSALLNSTFNPKYPTRLLIHGWVPSKATVLDPSIRMAYLKRGYFNVIAVDWSSIACNTNYQQVVSQLDGVGKHIAKFIDFLHDIGKMEYKTLYIIGHSLGGQIAGLIGKNVKKGKINTIFGLDPARPLFENVDTNSRLSSNDAEYVEIIHVNAGKLGILTPIGHASFYPNYGKIQNGCLYDYLGICSHIKVISYFAESVETIENHFKAKQCNSFQNIQERSCNWTGYIANMGGEPSNYGKSVKGIFYLETRATKPFAID